MKLPITVGLLAFALVAANAQKASPPSADYLMKTASAKAGKEGKSVLVIFHASWCGWCHRLDGFMSKTENNAWFEKNFAVVHLDVMEQPAQKALENAGGQDYMKRWGGETAGLPFMVVLSPAGKVLADSMATVNGKKSNIGCPWEAPEVSHFMKMMRTGAKHSSAAEFSALEKGLLGQKAAAAAGGGH